MAVAAEGGVPEEGAFLEVDETGDGDANAEGFVVEHFGEEFDGGGDEFFGSGDVSFEGVAGALAGEIQAAEFDVIGREEDAEDVAGVGVDFDGDAWSSAGGGACGALAEDAFPDEVSDDVTDAVGGLAGAFVEFPAAEPAFAPEDLEQFPFTFLHHGDPSSLTEISPDKFNVSWHLVQQNMGI